MSLLRCVSWSCAVAICLMASGTLRATTFLRGDTNGDGVVSVADAAFLMANLFFGSPPRLECEAAADFEDNERVEMSDALKILGFVVIGTYDAAGSGPPAQPFPSPGSDTTQGPDGFQLPCDAYGGGFSVEDPAAKLEVLDAVAPGGEDVRAVIQFRVSSSVPLWGYSATVSIGGGIAENAVYRPNDPTGMQELDAPTGGREGRFLAGRVEDGRLHAGFLVGTFTEPLWIPPGEDVSALAVSVCLKGGTRAGTYLLTLEAGELVHAWSREMDGDLHAPAGRAITPALVNGTLRVLADVLPERPCEVRPPAGELNAQFQLFGAVAQPGNPVTVPFVIRADRECQGFGFQIAFDASALEATDLEKLYPPAAGKPYRSEILEFDNTAGLLRGYVNFGLGSDDFALTPHQDHEVLALHFLVKPEATAAPTEIRFDESPEGGPHNFFKAFADTYTPETANAFLLGSGTVSVLPDGALFIRGDSNSDTRVDVSDAQFTLSYLFLGGERPPCLDAADANDDGRLDVSDAIATLGWLFLGQTSLPAPSGTAGQDPTPDLLSCFKS